MSEIFISYSRKDSQFVERLVKDLSRENRDVFYDLNLRAGDDYERVLSQMLREARFVLVVLSGNSLGSPYVHAEVQKALAAEHKGQTILVPILIEDCNPGSITNLIGKKTYADFTTNYESGLEKLNETLGRTEASKRKVRGSRGGSTKTIVTITTACLTAVVTLVTAYWQFVYKPNHQDDGQVQYAGRVLDAGTQKVITGAKVSVVTAGLPEVYYSDSEGVFFLKLPGNSQSAQIRVQATGYDTLERNVPLRRTGLEDIRLSASQPSTTPTPSAVPLHSIRPAANSNNLEHQLQTEPYNRPK